MFKAWMKLLMTRTQDKMEVVKQVMKAAQTWS